MCLEEAERCSVELHESLAYHGFVGSVAALNVHHHRDGHTAGNPFISRSCGVLDDAHVTRLACCDEAAGVEAQAVAVVGIVVARSSATAFVSEEVVLCAELRSASCLLEALCHHAAEQLLGLDEAHLHVAVGVAVKTELACNVVGQALEHCEVVLCDVALYECYLLLRAAKLAALTCGRISQHFVELLDELLDGRDELDKTLWDEHCTEVVAVFCTAGDDVGDVVHDVVETHLLLLHLLADETDVGLCLQCALQCDVACAAAHKLDEVPVLACTVAVTLYVADELRVGLACCVEAKAGLNLLVLQVAVDGLGATDDLHAILLGCIVLCQHAGVGVAVVTADNHESLDAELT